MLLPGHSVPFTLRFCFSMKKCPISGKLVSLPMLTSPLCTPALTLQADVLEAFQAIFFFKGAMQSKATPPNRLPECISSSGNSWLQSLNPPFARSLSILWWPGEKQHSPEETHTFQIQNHNLHLKTYSSTVQTYYFWHFFSFLHVWVIALNSAHFCNTLKLISLVLIF